MQLGERIIVMGNSGSGKSTFARQLGERFSLPVVHMDTIWWMPGWVSRPIDEVYAMHAAAIAEPAWVLEGNFSAKPTQALDERLARADCVIFIDINRLTCLYRACKRRVMFSRKTRPCMTEGCSERITWWLVKWIWGYPRRARSGILAWLGEILPPKQVLHLKGQRAVKNFLRELDKNH
ncbi:MAG: AAA family ATPase [Oscillospiraceae bacterium]|nr:AAA family ATPase [Oscillospiraceae bacterium]